MFSVAVLAGRESGILLDGLFGTLTGSTVSVENIGLLGSTRVGSHRVVQISAGFTIFFSILGKFGALFASIPFTIFATIYCVLFGLVASVGLSFLQFTNMNSMRNLFIYTECFRTTLLLLFMVLRIPKLDGCNVGQRFGQHIDESAILGDGKKTHYTFLIYLSAAGSKFKSKNEFKSTSDCFSEELVGGVTVFYGPRNNLVAELAPTEGMALFHIHGAMCMLHESKDCHKGC